ncbi:DUF3108 domain-containing protein [Fulvivirga sedimenti]|uniref:DUF3108 domain-containing protein n=1 Tax=Fulvivirga sedimenti TaxID=2879465 RepID=A0A9X1HPY4_9BACT|nr:DUF3108 domain-containing protein [Fulvivirga sedimenti]MCA6074622.1 DUF3108 domain-containing protein [Fulvivirga sedimenti]MCA6075799.1 DUF3108 domain-containing protein [Fulvivirga sedimenti]MCA6076927.1 DUF3108 domain-containing protein [Fulvivirga sedimenti]
MKSFIIQISATLCAVILFTAASPRVYQPVDHDSFGPGEELQYRVSFGIIGIGDARMVIDREVRSVNDRPVYKVDVYGKTTGMVDWVARVDDHWGSYVDTSALVPHISYRNIQEGNYRKNEITRFYHDRGVIETRTLDQKTGKYKEPKVFHNQRREIRDMLAGYLYLRTVDFSGMKKGDSFEISGFLEDTFYDMKMVYGGVERIKTKAGKFRAIKLVPVMPEGGVFDGEKSVTLWISADENKVPLKIEAKMFVGNTTLELSGFNNLRHPVSGL